MVKFTIVALCVTAFTVGGSAESPEEYGMDMTVRAYDAVCWYETLKNFPETRTKDYNKCSGQAAFQKKNIMTNDFFEKNPSMRKEYFGKWIAQNALPKLDKPYPSKCGKFLDEPDADPPADESDALNDGGKKYIYRAFAFCLMNTLRQNHGDEAIDAVKNERTHSKKNWMQALLDRENEFRARHGSEPLELVKDLNDAAQAWAETNANECKMYHSKNSDSGRQFQGEGTGESLSAGGGDDDKEVAAYIAADGWYEEVKDYPFPEGYDGEDKSLFEKIGHFTQSVWKNSRYVGYGYKFAPDCAPYKRFVVARYFPAGNMEGAYPENVLPPKDK